MGAERRDAVMCAHQVRLQDRVEAQSVEQRLQARGLDVRGEIRSQTASLDVADEDPPNEWSWCRRWPRAPTATALRSRATFQLTHAVKGDVEVAAFSGVSALTRVVSGVVIVGVGALLTSAGNVAVILLILTALMSVCFLVNRTTSASALPSPLTT